MVNHLRRRPVTGSVSVTCFRFIGSRSGDRNFERITCGRGILKRAEHCFIGISLPAEKVDVDGQRGPIQIGERLFRNRGRYQASGVQPQPAGPPSTAVGRSYLTETRPASSRSCSAGSKSSATRACTSWRPGFAPLPACTVTVSPSCASSALRWPVRNGYLRGLSFLSRATWISRTVKNRSLPVNAKASNASKRHLRGRARIPKLYVFLFFICMTKLTPKARDWLGWMKVINYFKKP